MLADGAGPIYTGYYDKNGNPYFVINGQTGHSATVYKGDGTGNFAQIANYNVSNFGEHIYSMLLQDMDVPADGIADMVVEGDNGVIEIHKGNGDGTFVTTSEGGTRQPQRTHGQRGPPCRDRPQDAEYSDDHAYRPERAHPTDRHSELHAEGHL